MIHLNQIPAETPPDHIHAAAAACHAYGRFPIPKDLSGVRCELPKRASFAQFLRAKGERIDAWTRFGGLSTSSCHLIIPFRCLRRFRISRYNVAFVIRQAYTASYS
jgi:LmbE family N-acetylglucosaminyl deacetylase